MDQRDVAGFTVVGPGLLFANPEFYYDVVI